ncbi:MAG: histidine kinase [Chitinophagaceae bacterium]|nr:histidine kinase [Chitinophagaceae bacterium]
MAQQLYAGFVPERIFIKNINLKDGLSQCVVTDIVQDKRGFLWMGTFDGLNRFDGHQIKVFRHKPSDKNSLPASKIQRLYTDRDNHIYLLTNDGFCIFDGSTGSVVTPDVVKLHQAIWVCQEDEHHIWMYTRKDKLLLVDTRDFSYVIKKEMPEFQQSRHFVFDILKSGGKLFIVAGNGDIIAYDPATNREQLHINDLKNPGLFNNAGKDKNGDILLGSLQADLIRFDVSESKYYRSEFYKLNEKLIGVNRIVYDSIHDILFLTCYGQGIFSYDYQTKTLQQYKKKEGILDISANYPISFLVNQYGLIYVGYDGMGMDILDPFLKKFIPIRKLEDDDLQSLRFVRKIVEDDEGNLLIGTSGSGLVKYNRLSKLFTFLTVRNKLSTTDNFIIEMIRVGDELWLGFNGSGIGVVDIHTLKMRRSILPGPGMNDISDGSIWSFLNDSMGSVWVGTRENGLNKISLKDGSVKQFTVQDYPDFRNNGLRCLFMRRNKQMLLGTENGLFTIDPKQNFIQSVFPRKEDPSGKSFKSVKCMYEDRKGRIWLGTDGAGIVVLDAQYRMLTNFSSNDFLNSNVIYALLPQNDSVFWMSSNSGISKLIWNESSLGQNGKVMVFNYDESNGLQSNEFNTGAYAVLKDGSMAFGGVSGLNVFKPEEILNYPVSPEVYISEFKVFENNLKSATNIAYLSEVNLKHYENSISLSFGVLGFSLPSRTRYMYRLLGYDKEWIMADTRNYVSYTNLSSGHYEFQVKASNSDGVWNDQFTSLKINIPTPYYLTWWFLSLIGLIVATIVYSFYKYRVSQIAEKEEMKIRYTKELAEVEMKALRAQINPHFLFNSLNSINNFILRNDTRQASRYLVKFSQLVRNILNHSSSAYITLEEELNTIELYMLIEGMRFNNQFSYTITVDPNLNPGNVMIPSLLLQPYVENAIWHGLLHKDGEKSIHIRISKISEHQATISIDDNGVGRLAAQQLERKTDSHKSFGMELGENRLRLMGSSNGQTAKVEVKDLYDEALYPAGTQILITIPIKQYSLQAEVLTQLN